MLTKPAAPNIGKLLGLYGAFSGRENTDLEELLLDNGITNVSTLSLLRLSRKNAFAADRLAGMMLEIPAEPLAASFGAPVIAWAIAARFEADASAVDALEYLQRIGQPLGDIAKRSWGISSLLRSNSTSQNLAEFRFRFSPLPDLEEAQRLLTGHLKPGVAALSTVRNYQLGILTRHRWGGANELRDLTLNTDRGDKIFPVIMDAPLGYCLYCKGEPNALICFELSKNGKTARVLQIQGAKGILKTRDAAGDREEQRRVPNRGLAPLVWQDLMLEALERRLHACGIEKVLVQPGRRNMWAKVKDPGSNQAHLPIDAACRNYDEPAVRQGYRRRLDGFLEKRLGAAA